MPTTLVIRDKVGWVYSVRGELPLSLYPRVPRQRGT